MQRTPTKGNQPGNDSMHGTSANLVHIVPFTITRICIVFIQLLRRVKRKDANHAFKIQRRFLIESYWKCLLITTVFKPICSDKKTHCTIAIVILPDIHI